MMRTNLLELAAIPDWIGRGVAMPFGSVLVAVFTVVEELRGKSQQREET